jgi:hypothetical protein
MIRENYLRTRVNRAYLRSERRRMNKKTRNIAIGAAAVAVVAAVAGIVAYMLAKKKKKTTITCTPGTTLKNAVTMGTGESSITIDGTGKIGTITLEKGYEIPLHKGVIPTMELPACMAPTGNVTAVLGDGVYTTSGVLDASAGASWIFRFYPAAEQGGNPKLYLHFSAADADGTRNTTHFWPPQADGTLTLASPVNLGFNML